MDACSLFDSFWIVDQKHTTAPILRHMRARIIYNSDWIRLKEESHINVGCFEGG